MPKKDISNLKKEIMRNQSNLSSKFQLKLTAQKEYCQYKKENNGNYHQISHIYNNRGSKFQLQRTILIFFKQTSPKKDTSSRKQKK